MAAPYKPTRTFTGTYDDEMVGTATVDQINTDQDEQNKMFDPASTHGDGTPGGIHKGNLMTGSGIVAEDANGDVTITRDVKATRQLVSEVADGTPPLVVSSTTEVANLKAAAATLADAAKGDTRWQIQGTMPNNTEIDGNGFINYSVVVFNLSAGQTLKLKGIKVSAYSSINIQIRDVNVADVLWETNTTVYSFEEVVLKTGPVSTNKLYIGVKNTTGNPVTVGTGIGYWFDLAIE
jgi:hypothetical protein